ncbi:hypothetical protein DX873_10755 [Flagellimonas nanhaiensis]|uniref:Lipopolysaccharide biosynthesis protein n=2 Tax=Flagellimonas nanhaiensis TaxID=2292706 RepID=A0A371JQQ3_9FLAO|nr:hypothetical protein DX873_10755 [Allomuricauda nanhaiensis]
MKTAKYYSVFIMKLLRNLFFKNVLKIFTGTFLAQLIMLAGMPIITRIYEKETIGLYALFISTIGITSSFASLAYDNTIVLPKKDKHAFVLLKITLTSAFVMSCLIGLVLKVPIGFFDEYREIAFFVAIATFVQVFIISLGYCKIRFNDYNRLSWSKVLRNLVLILLQIGLFYVTPYGMEWGFIVSGLAGVFFLIYKDQKILNGLFSKVSKKSIRKELLKYKEYPKFFCWSNLVLALSAGMPILVFTEYYSLAQVGVYSIALSLIVQPASLISSSIRPVLLSKLAQKKNNNKTIVPIYNKAFVTLMVGSIFISIGIFVFFPPIVEFVFGKDWSQSGVLTRYLIPIFIWYFISIPSSVSMKVYPFQKYAFWYTMVSFVSITSMVLISSYYNFTFHNVVLLYAIASLSFSLINHLLVKRKISIFEKLQIKQVEYDSKIV